MSTAQARFGGLLAILVVIAFAVSYVASRRLSEPKAQAAATGAALPTLPPRPVVTLHPPTFVGRPISLRPSRRPARGASAAPTRSALTGTGGGSGSVTPPPRGTPSPTSIGGPIGRVVVEPRQPVAPVTPTKPATPSGSDVEVGG